MAFATTPALACQMLLDIAMHLFAKYVFSLFVVVLLEGRINVVQCSDDLSFCRCRATMAFQIATCNFQMVVSATSQFCRLAALAPTHAPRPRLAQLEQLFAIST